VSLTAVVTSHNYARYLRQCLESAIHYCDEVLVFDDASTDESVAIVAEYNLTCVIRHDKSGGPVWGSNRGIEMASCSHLVFLDADNYLVGAPPQNDVDYTFAPIEIVDGNGSWLDRWEYGYWPLTAQACLQRFRETRQMPYPWGGVWRTEFIRDLRWIEWPRTQMAADFRTAIDWCTHSPTLAYHPTSFLAFRQHDASWSASGEREIMQADANALVI